MNLSGSGEIYMSSSQKIGQKKLELHEPMDKCI